MAQRGRPSKAAAPKVAKAESYRHPEAESPAERARCSLGNLVSNVRRRYVRRPKMDSDETAFPRKMNARSDLVSERAFAFGFYEKDAY